MAEAIELDFTVTQSGTKISESNLAESLRELSSAAVETVLDADIPEEYQIKNYYKNDTLGQDVMKLKYLAPWERHPWDLWKRVSSAIASVEKTKKARENWTENFFSILEDFKFVPGGRIMHGAGREDIKSTLNNCYVVAIKDDSIDAIYQTINEEALTYKYGGGCGHDLSILRPAGDSIKGTGGESCGPVGFMNLFSENTNTIAQHGRRGANMQTLRVDHPDIEKFIDIKRGNLEKIKYSNISVLITNEFMAALAANTTFDLRWNNKVYRTVDARELWNRIISNAHHSAEPGLIFWDTMVEYHNAEYCSPLVSTNPCAEQPLPDGGCCNLGSINLERFIDDQGNFLIGEFKETVIQATRFLDNVIDYNIDRHALEIQKQNAINDRRIGLGLLGLGDMLVKMSIKYDSVDALETVEQVCQIFRDTAYEASINLAREKSSFPNFDWEQYNKSKFIKNLPKSIRDDIGKDGIRNSTILTLPPTGSGAIVARVTSGIEPIFNTSYTRRVKKNHGSGDTFNEYKVYHPIIEKLFGDDSNLPDYIITAHDIDPYFRVKMQGVIQKYIDSSISSTVNLPHDITIDTIADIYLSAYKAGLKGITVYREGSREGILISDTKTKPKTTAQQTLVAAEAPTASATTTAGVSARPRHRPLITSGITRRIRTGEGTLYITINEDENGLCEVFTTIGKAGGHAAAQSEAISRLISLSLRSGIEPQAIVKQLKGISGPNPTWEDGQLILSTPDAIGKALDDYLKARKLEPEEEYNVHPFAFVDNAANNAAQTATVDGEKSQVAFKFEVCPKCSGNNLKSEAGCVICHDCGYSKCD